MPIPYSAIFELIGVYIRKITPEEVNIMMDVNDLMEKNFTPNHLIMYESDLPKMTNYEYLQWYADSLVIDGVRMGPVVKPKSLW